MTHRQHKFAHLAVKLSIVTVFVVIITRANILPFGSTAPLVVSPTPSTHVTASQPPLPVVTPTVAPTTPTPSPASTPIASSPEPTPLPSPAVEYQYHALLDGIGPLYTREQFLNRLSIPAGWAAARDTGRPTIIAVIDTGFALSHEALASRWAGTRGTSSWLGYDFVHNDNDPSAGSTNPNGAGVTHGTLTAGLASLIDPSATIMPLQALEDDGTGYTSSIASAVRYAADHGATVINLSLGSNADDSYLHSQITYAINRGIVVVAAAGNDGCNCLIYPANYPEVLSVGATNGSSARAGFSSYGSNLDVVAPGTGGDVCSTLYTAANGTNAYSCGYQGTSFASPITAGLAALIQQTTTGLSPAQIITAIQQSADIVPDMAGARSSIYYGYGQINVMNAVLYASYGSGSTTTMLSATSTVSTVNAQPQTDVICTAPTGGTCDLKIISSTGNTLSLGQRTISILSGGSFSLYLRQAGLSPGTWLILPTISSNGQTFSLPPITYVAT